MVSVKTLMLTMALAIASPIDISKTEVSLLPRAAGKEPIPVAFRYNGALYVHMKVGSQQEDIQVLWDTGSYKTWFPAANMSCSSKHCTDYGSFNISESTTFIDEHQKFSVGYVGFGVKGGWGIDQVTFGGASNNLVNVKDYEFGVGTSGSSRGILGMALNGKTTPNYLPTRLKDQGHINKAAFAYWFDAPQGKTGSFLFGGNDEAKYEGELVSVPRRKDIGGMKIDLGTITVGDNAIKVGKPAVIDTGADAVIFPKETLKQLVVQIGGEEALDTWDTSHYFVECDQGDKTFSFVFGDNNATLTVPVKNVLGKPWPHANYKCAIEIGPKDYFLLGIPVQKAGYWVFDQDDDTISLGKPTYSSDSKIVSL